MAFYPVPNGALVRFMHSFRGQQMINTMWFEHDGGPPNQSDVLALANGVGAQWGSSLASLLSNDVTYLGCIARDYTAQDSWAASYSTTVLGTASDAMPNNVALCFKLDTGQAGRAKRGRIFVGGIPRAAVVENDVSAAGFATDCLVALAGFVGSGFVVAGWTLSVAHRRSAGTWLPAGQLFPVQSINLTNLVVDSQRRRLPGRGV